MFINLKNKIKELARNAVFAAENELGSGKGQEKKQMAINYIVRNLPFSDLVKTIISMLLSSFIDDAVELAVKYMHSMPSKQGE